MENKDLNVIQVLRLPLMIWVVIIHGYIMQYDIMNSGVSYTAFGGIQYLFSQVFARTAVPLFFMFSGYLFFYNVEKLDWKIYTQKIGRRIKSLVVPYVLWNILFMAFICLIQHIQNDVSTGEDLLVKDFTFPYFLKMMWNKGYGAPFMISLWFIRDLFIVCLVSPCIYWLLQIEKRYLKQFIIIVPLLVIFYIVDYEVVIKGGAVVFFAIGACFSIAKKSFIPNQWIGRGLVAVYVILVIVEMMFNIFWSTSWLHNMNVIIGMFATIYVGSRLSIPKTRYIDKIWNTSFFLYASHLFLLARIRWVLCQFFYMGNEFHVLLIYVLSIGLTILFCTLIAIVMQRCLPRTYKILCGGR